MWVRKVKAFPTLVSHDQFDQAAKTIEFRSRRFSEGEMIEKLRDPLLKERKLSGILIA